MKKAKAKPKDYSEIMRNTSNKQPLWKKQLANHKVQKILRSRRVDK